MLFSLATARSYEGWRGYLLAVAMVAACFGLRETLELFGQFYYLPLVPAVVVTAMLSGRGPTILAGLLCVTLNVLLVPREGVVDTAVNAALFILEGWLISEICWAQRRQHDQIRAANARAQDLDAQLNRVWRLNSLGEMAATLAHELNQPLSAAATYMHASQRDIEKTGLMGQSAGRTLELAKGQVLRAGKIIRRMRDQLATGTRSLEAERVSSMIEDLGPVFALISRERGVEIRTEIDPDDDGVRAERIQFQQAMINLVRNAVDAAADRPQPVVMVTGRSAGQAGYHVTVEDSGPGIEGDDIERIFQPMTTTKSAGMGLGLSVTRTIVESHGGVLAVGRSALGGAAFAVDLPREIEDAA